MAEHKYSLEEINKILSAVKGKTLGDPDVDKNRVFNRTINNEKITGIAGDVIEQSVFGYPADTKQEPDLNVDGEQIELKTTGLKKLNINDDKTKYEAKEPMSITAVSPDKIVDEEFEDSVFWDKAKSMLFVYYLYDSKSTVKAADYAKFPIIDYQFHKFNEEEKKTLCNDWSIVRDFIRDVKNQNKDKEIEFPKISKLRDRMLMMDTAPKYPHNPRFRLKRTVVTNIYHKIYNKQYEELPKDYSSYADIDQECRDLRNSLSGMTIKEIALKPEIDYKKELVNKAVCEKLVIRMFGGKSGSFSNIDVFNKCGLICKTITLTKRGLYTEQMKLFQIDFDELLDDSISFEESSFKDYFSQHQLLCVVFEEPSHDSPLKDNVFKGFKRISFTDEFIENEVKPVWEKIRSLVKNKQLIDEVQYRNGKPLLNKTGVISSAPNFPKQKDGTIFVRGSGQDSNYKNLEINGIRMYSQYIWIKGKYIIDELNKVNYL